MSVTYTAVLEVSEVLQVVSAPHGWPPWTFGVRPGREHMVALRRQRTADRRGTRSARSRHRHRCQADRLVTVVIPAPRTETRRARRRPSSSPSSRRISSTASGGDSARSCPAARHSAATCSQPPFTTVPWFSRDLSVGNRGYLPVAGRLVIRPCRHGWLLRRHRPSPAASVNWEFDICSARPAEVYSTRKVLSGSERRTW